MSMISEFVKALREKSALFSRSDFVFAVIAKDYKEAADIIEELSAKLSSANKERSEQYYKDVPDTNVGKWIPVSEKLPDDFMSYEYLTIRKGQTLATITYYCVVNHKWYSNRKSTKEIDVVAWQPLPQLCKGEYDRLWQEIKNMKHECKV